MKSKIGIIAIVILLIGGLLHMVSVYNSMVNKEEEVKKAWSQVENQYQRRADLIPPLVNTVKGYAKYEKAILEAVILARSKATQINISADNLTPEKLNEFQNAQNGLSSALSKLSVVVERYPDLKANQNFVELMAQLEGTENRIAYERKRFNDTSKTYNVYLRTFPNNMFASIFGFKPQEYFKADSGAKSTIDIDFEN